MVVRVVREPLRSDFPEIILGGADIPPEGCVRDVRGMRRATLQFSEKFAVSTPAEAVAIRGDYLSAITEPDDSFENERIFETEATLGSIDFGTNQKWRVETTREGTRKANIEDLDFLHGLDRGDAIHKNDIFWLKIRETVTKERGRNASTEWAVIEVKRTKRGDTDGDSRDDTTTPSDAPAS